MGAGPLAGMDGMGISWGAAWTDETIDQRTNQPDAIALGGGPAMEVLRKRGRKRLSPGGGMCDRLVGPDLTHRSAPTHAQAAAQRARVKGCGEPERHSTMVSAERYRTGSPGFSGLHHSNAQWSATPGAACDAPLLKTKKNIELISHVFWVIIRRVAVTATPARRRNPLSAVRLFFCDPCSRPVSL